MLEFPRNLPGLTMGVTTRMKWAGTVQPHASGSEGRLSYWSEPMWEWDLSYDMVRDGFLNQGSFDELAQIEGLFGVSLGTTLGFKFFNPRANRVFQQLIGTTDGVATNFDLIRTYGPFSKTTLQGTEHIGVLSTEMPFNLYIDNSSTPVDVSDATYGYTLSVAIPGKQQLVFNSAPATDHTIRVDMGYFFYARFQSSPLEYDKFFQDLWTMKRVTLQSLRAETL